MIKDSNSLHFRNINFGDVSLDYYWGASCLSDIVQSISKIDADKYFIVTDDVVYDLYVKHFEKTLLESKPTFILKAPPGEHYKSIEVLNSYFNQCFVNGISRKSLIVGFGGGIPGNIAGLLASLIYRGIKFIQIPTTSVAMFDSVLSLKQAINSNFSKNSIGAFYKPESIYVDLSMLSTLPENHRRSGLCETIKNALAITPENIDMLKANLKKALEGDYAALSYILKSSIDAKEYVMSKDSNEKLDAVVLEYGHTIGHAIELALTKNAGVSISHGEAVGLGMLAAAHISNKLGLLDSLSLEMHYELLEEIASPTTLNLEIGNSDVLKLLMFDNKRGYVNTENDQIPMILLKSLGKPIYSGRYPLFPAPLSLIEESLNIICDSRKYAAL